MDGIPGDGGYGWKNEDSKRRIEKMWINQKIRIKRENADSKKKKKTNKHKKEKKKERKKEKRRSVKLLLRTAVKIYMYSPLLKADREVEN